MWLASFVLQLADLGVGRAHLDAQGFGFVVAGDGAAIVVRERDQRAADHAVLKDSLAAR